MKRCLKTAREIDRRIVEADIRLSSRDHFPHPVETWKWQHQPINLRVDRRQGKNQLSRSVKFYIQCMHILCMYVWRGRKLLVYCTFTKLKNDNDHIMRSIYMHMMIFFLYTNDWNRSSNRGKLIKERGSLSWNDQ